ncbi:MAG TPA: helix-turn-helix transcriptional regulator [Gemmatimonadaceae bacterium]|nr:helix-turn-helix transcriptional regulator [Gemmatimonadaceae bacterium]
MFLALSSLETHRFSGMLSLLLSPLAQQDAQVWRHDVARHLCELVGADDAALVIEQPEVTRIQAVHLDPAAIRAYQTHYAKVDLGLARLRTLGVEVWSRRMLWDPDVLARSEYYNDFAIPHRLHDTIGLAVAVRAVQARVRAALFHHRPVSDLSMTRRQLQMLALVLPAFGTGISAHLRWNLWRSHLTAMLEDTDDPVALCDVSGRMVHENAALAHVLRGKCGPLVRETIVAVARAVFAAVALGHVDESIMRRVLAGSIDYEIRGTVVEPLASQLPMTILVTTTPHRVDTISAHDLRTRYNLTARELEVADLLRRRRSNTEIARALAISEHTARRHTENVLLKLGLHSRNEVEVVLRVQPHADVSTGSRRPRATGPDTGENTGVSHTTPARDDAFLTAARATLRHSLHEEEPPAPSAPNG